MSTYTDYDKISKTYDNGRKADGVEMMVMVLSGILKKKPSEIKLLEAGCGTGNYSLGFLEENIGKLTMNDASEGMLNKAKEKTEKYQTQVEEIKQVFLPCLPYPDATFDGVTFIQVLHHLDTHFKDDENHTNGKDDGNQTFPNLTKALEETYRVLKPGGVILIDTCFRENLHALAYSLLPSALDFNKSIFINEEELMNKMKVLDFENMFYIVRPNSTYLQQNKFENILDPEWRKHDSGWYVPESKGELAPLLKMLQEKKDNGTLNGFEHEFYRKQRLIGNHTVLFAQKPIGE